MTFYWKARNLLRDLNKDQFEEVFENPYGFQHAYLLTSQYKVWGANGSEEKLAVILDCHIDLDKSGLEFQSVLENGQISIQGSDDFYSYLTELVSIFMDEDNIDEFNDVAGGPILPIMNQPLPWLLPTKVFLFIRWTDENGAKKESGLLIALDVEDNYFEDGPEFKNATEHFEHLVETFNVFYQKNAKYFDAEGNYIGKAGPEKWKYLK